MKGKSSDCGGAIKRRKLRTEVYVHIDENRAASRGEETSGEVEGEEMRNKSREGEQKVVGKSGTNEAWEGVE